ncbi:hypothetical protein DL96DRAFT_1468322 [Flagelloscypha sp. PMI_526]|nr:hypothetical protein DL96DRAFT_1468322 [Flagelloscypha sp. PMI_526]
MPLRRSTRQKPSNESTAATHVIVDYPVYPDASPANTPVLVTFAPELIDEIISYLPSDIPLDWNYDTMDLMLTGTGQLLTEFGEKRRTLRALASSCRAFRKVFHPRAWERLDCAFVPQGKSGTWYKYVAEETSRKVNGVLENKQALRGYIRTFSFIMTKSATEQCVEAVGDILKVLPNLHTIYVLFCNCPTPLKGATTGLSLPSVRTLVIHTGASCLLHICPNVTRVRCVGGDGNDIISALKSCPKIQRVEGGIRWGVKLRDSMRLVNGAPNLRVLELYPSMNEANSLQYSKYTSPEDWPAVIASLDKLKNLQVLILSFSSFEVPEYLMDPLPKDEPSVINAKEVMKKLSEQNGASSDRQERKLVVRKVISRAPDFRNDLEMDIVGEN